MAGQKGKHMKNINEYAVTYYHKINGKETEELYIAWATSAAEAKAKFVEWHKGRIINGKNPHPFRISVKRR